MIFQKSLPLSQGGEAAGEIDFFKKCKKHRFSVVVGGNFEKKNFKNRLIFETSRGSHKFLTKNRHFSSTVHFGGK